MLPTSVVIEVAAYRCAECSLHISLATPQRAAIKAGEPTTGPFDTMHAIQCPLCGCAATEWNPKSEALDGLCSALGADYRLKPKENDGTEW